MADPSQPAPDFQAIFDAHPTPSLVLSPDLVVEAVNQARQALNLRRREEVVGRPLFEVIAENPELPIGGVDLLRTSLSRVLTTRSADCMPVVRYDIRDPSGRFVPHWWAPQNVPVLDSDGAVRHIVHSVKDVTEGVQAGQEARMAREREAYIVANTEDYAILVTDVDRRVTSWSPGAAATFGYSEREALGLLADEMFTPEDRAADVPAKEAEQARRDGTAPDNRWHLRKDGSRVFVRGSMQALYGLDGTVTGFLKIAHDETRDREFVEALEASEVNFRALADSMPVLVFVTEAEGSVTYTNRRYQEFTGLSGEALAGQGWLQVVHPDDVAPLMERWKAAVASGQPFEAEARIRASSGEHRWFLNRATPVSDAAGRGRRWFGACSDIDDQRRAKDRQVLLNQEIGHRVKNSLQLVWSFLSLQARMGPETARPLIEDAARRVRAVAHVHDQLWRQSAQERIRLDPFLDDLCESLAEAAPRHTTTYSFEPDSVAVDAAAPIGLWVNEALTNAYKYAYPAGQEGAVEVRGARIDGRYRIEVRDWGVGLPEGFDLHTPGESLGLRVMSALAQQLGAEFRAENAGPGARFTLVTPL